MEAVGNESNTGNSKQFIALIAIHQMLLYMEYYSTILGLLFIVNLICLAVCLHGGRRALIDLKNKRPNKSHRPLILCQSLFSLAYQVWLCLFRRQYLLFTLPPLVGVLGKLKELSEVVAGNHNEPSNEVQELIRLQVFTQAAALCFEVCLIVKGQAGFEGLIALIMICKFKQMELLGARIGWEALYNGLYNRATRCGIGWLVSAIAAIITVGRCQSTQQLSFL